MTQIDKTNVACLAPRWVFPIPNVTQVENTPIVIGGIIVYIKRHEVYVLDAAMNARATICTASVLALRSQNR